MKVYLIKTSDMTENLLDLSVGRRFNRRCFKHSQKYITGIRWTLHLQVVWIYQIVQLMEISSFTRCSPIFRVRGWASLILRRICETTMQITTDIKGHFMADETIFSKIIRKEIPTDILYQDDLVTAFRDINPRAPSHILIVPNRLIPTVNDVEDSDELALGRLFTVAKKLAAQEGIADDGYRLIVNCNSHGGQEVYHIHMHFLGGKPLGPLLMN
jgi:histidine triad (HIT) family protein